MYGPEFVVYKKIRRSQNPLAQVVKRLAEAASCKKLSTLVNNPPLLLSNPHFCGPLPDRNNVIFETKQYRTAVLDPDK